MRLWLPYYRRDEEALVRVQKGFTRMLSGLKGISNQERLYKLELFSPEING